MTLTRTSLSVAASAVRKALAGSFEVQELDAGFDGGEWSGPAHEADRPALVSRVLAPLGWTPEAFEAELEARTTTKWAHFSDLTGWGE